MQILPALAEAIPGNGISYCVNVHMSSLLLIHITPRQPSVAAQRLYSQYKSELINSDGESVIS